MRCHRFNSRQQHGAALVIAMLVFALCSALVVAMQKEFTLFYQRGSNVFLAEQAYAYLRGAEDLAAMALVLDADADQGKDAPRDDLQEIWAQPPTPYTLDEGGWLMGSLEDLQGRFNLNTLLPAARTESGSVKYSASQQQFIRLLQALPELEISQQQAVVITQSIGDWLDSDSIASVNGAEDDFYSGLEPPYRSANRPMMSVTELQAISNITPQIYRALAPWVSVWPQEGGTLNIHTAPAMVLRTINADGDLQPLSEIDATSLVEYRDSTGFADIADLLAQPALAGKQLDEVTPLLGETSNYFLLAAEAEVAERQVRLYSVLERRGRAINALARASGSL
ncbi:MAG: type II secretion system minor pseudopilin GspK [Halioglobus sp.]